MKKEIKIKEDSGRLLASLFGEIDHHTAAVMREEIDTALFEYRPKILVLDFGAVRFMDSSGIALIIGRAEISKSIGCSVQICGLSRTLLRVVQLSGIERIRGIEVL